jgi:hypothetical protein
LVAFELCCTLEYIHYAFVWVSLRAGYSLGVRVDHRPILVSYKLIRVARCPGNYQIRIQVCWGCPISVIWLFELGGRSLGLSSVSLWRNSSPSSKYRRMRANAHGNWWLLPSGSSVGGPGDLSLQLMVLRSLVFVKLRLFSWHIASSMLAPYQPYVIGFATSLMGPSVAFDGMPNSRLEALLARVVARSSATSSRA